jgi:hypothetical protein
MITLACVGLARAAVGARLDRGVRRHRWHASLVAHAATREFKVKIFRGRSTKPVDAPEHELVADVSLGQASTFSDGKLVVLANVSKDPVERQSIAHILIDAEDLLALQRRMLTGLSGVAEANDGLRARMRSAARELYELYEGVVIPDQDSLDPQDRASLMEDALKQLQESIGTLAASLDDRTSSP